MLFIKNGFCYDGLSLGIFGKNRLKSVLGQDGVRPIEVKFKNGEKKYLWTFGDTIIGGWKGPVVTTATTNFNDFADMKFLLSNTLALTDLPDINNYDNLEFTFYLGKGVNEFIKYKDNENPQIVRMWADDGIWIDNDVYVFYMDIRINKDIPGGFELKGSGLCFSKIPYEPDISKFLFKRIDEFYAKNILIGDSVIKKKRWIYILGRISQNNNEKLNSIFVSRVKPNNIKDFSSYEFLSKNGKWQKKEIGKFFDDVVGEASMVWDENKKIFRMIYISSKTQEIKEITFSNFKKFVKEPKVNVIYKPENKNVFYYSAKEVFYLKNYVYLIYIDPSIYQPIIVRYQSK